MTLPEFNSRMQALGVALLAALFHLWNLGGEFVFDDGIYIVMNPAVQAGLADWPRFFTDPGTYAGVAKSHYRPFVTLSYAANIEMGWGIAGFKITQVVMHVLTAVGLLWVVRRLLQGLRIDLPGVPFLAAALFATMPFNVEAVHYLAARSAVLCGLFSVISVGLFLTLRHVQERGGGRVGLGLLYLAHLAALAMALLSKETALTLPGLLLVIDLLWFTRREAGFPKRLRFWWPYLPYLAGMVLVLAVMPNVEWAFKYLAKVFGEEWRLSAAIFCLVENIRLMLLPFGLTLSHPISEAGRLTDPLTIGSAMVTLVLLASAWMARNRAPLWTVGMCWYFLLIAPSTFVHLNTVLMENRGYTASMGISLAVAGAIGMLWRAYPRWRMPVASGLTGLMLMFAGVGYQRQQVWASNLTVWQDAVAHNPGSAEAWANLGKAHFDRGEWDRAEAAYRRVLSIRPDAITIMANLAGVFLKQHRYPQALAVLERLVAQDPFHPAYWVNLFHAQSALGRRDAALTTLENLLKAEHRNAIRRRYANPLAPGQAATIMVNLALELNRPERADWAINMLRQTVPDYPLLDLLKMRRFAASGDLTAAEAALAALKERFAGDPRIREWERELARYRPATAGSP